MKADELRDRLAARLGGRVDGVRRLSGGASGETWSFTHAPNGEPPRPLILRRETRQLVGPRVPEAAIFAAVARAGVPVPGVVVDGEQDDALGAPYLIVEHVDGETIPRKILRDEEYAAALPKMAAQCGEILARIHRVPVDEVPGLEQNDELTRYRELLDMFDQPHPAFELAFRWLAERRPPTTGVSLVHGDFRNGNLIVGPEGVRAVLDWELAHLGDPMEDLGWLCVRAWRFGSPLRVGGFGDEKELFDAYERESGRPVDPDVVRWWEVLGTLKWGIMCIAQAFSHLSGAARSVELATIGRRVCENEWDLLDLMASGGSVPPYLGSTAAKAASNPDGGMHGRPTALELVAAVREFLESDVMGATEGRVQFHTRVSVNALRMVERELELGESQASEHAAALAALGVADEAALAAAIREGALDDRTAEVLAAVRQTVRAKLDVANPRYTEE